MIYGSLLTDIFNTQDDEAADTYRLSSQWPACNYSTYASLVRTCKQIKGEAVPYFEARFLCTGFTIYCDTVRQFHQVYDSTAALKPAYQDKIRFSLRTKCNLLSRDYALENAEQSSLLRIMAPTFEDWLTKHLSRVRHTFGEQAEAGASWHDCLGCDTRLHVVIQHGDGAEEGALVQHYHLPAAKEGASVVARQVEGDLSTLYIQVRGRLRDFADASEGMRLA
ncbi:hypothetical protein LTR85_002731 [Meristemomyces frigidus]|nr:hypothetical protein LTR85_002731 [Meristemomyces frigidus]